MATITAEEAQKIAKASKSEGRQHLLEALNWAVFDEEKHMRRSIHLDFLYDSLMFAVERGFAWERAANVVLFADKILNQIKKCENITEILGFYNGCSTTLYEVFGERDFKIFTSYIFETVLPHFKLYQLVFTNERQAQIPNVNLKVEPPFESNQLKETKPVKVWEYEKRIMEIEEKQNERLTQVQSQKEQKVSKLDDEKKEVLSKTLEVSKPLDKDSVANIIQDVMKQFTLAATENLKFEVERMQEDLEFKLEKTSLPRPQVLGPPPRYSVQPQSKAQSAKVPKSPKPGSRASGRSKKK